MALLLTWSGYALHPTNATSAALSQWRAGQAKSPPFLLDPRRRQLILATICEHCRTRNWQLHALHIRETHLHLVLTASENPGRIIGELKSTCTRALRQAGLAEPDQRVWADYRNAKSLCDARALHNAIRYVLQHQGPPLDVWPPSA